MRDFPIGGALRSLPVSRNPSDALTASAVGSGRKLSGFESPAAAGLGNNVKSVGQTERKERRHVAYKAKNTAAHILRNQGDKLLKLSSRVSHCRYVAYQPSVSLEVAESKARFDGLKSCNSVWCCPLCSSRISHGRRDELNTLLAGARASGLSVVMLTLTASHKRDMVLASWLEAFKLAKKALRNHRSWRSFKPSFVGSVTATEVTHSEANGFHPHFHEILVLDCPAQDAVASVERLRSAWLASLAGVGLSGGDAAFQVQPASAAGDYIGKFGAAEELALAGNKQGRGGSRTPWQLLLDAGDADNPRRSRDASIWAEYAAAFVGRRQLVWSPGLKSRFGIGDVSDDALPDPDAVSVPHLLRVWGGSSDGWRSARRRSVALLNAAETGGDLDVAEFGPTDASRWFSRPSSVVIDPGD